MISKKLSNCKIITFESGSGSYEDLRIPPTKVFLPAHSASSTVCCERSYALYKSSDPNLSARN